ncbi:hypothetical protein IAT40_004557 [Kwoniella sp. CBS 6097]
MSFGILSSPSHAYMMSTPRSSSPLNPNNYGHQPQHHPSSSSPMTSPTPMYSQTSTHLQSFPFPSLASASTLTSHVSAGPSSSSSSRYTFNTSTNGNSNGFKVKPKNSSPGQFTSQPRYSAQRSKRYSLPAASSSPSSSSHTHPADLFSEASTPTESLLWRERFSRRAEERERRKKARDADLDRRRGVTPSYHGHGVQIVAALTPEEEEEADRRAQQDDEEIFRRLVILQRNKAHRAALVSHEQEVGDSDLSDIEPFWEEEEKALLQRLELEAPSDHSAMKPHPISRIDNQNHIQHQGSTTPQRTGEQWTEMRTRTYEGNEEDEMERWEREAAEAEQAEHQIEVEEAALAEEVERAYQLSGQHGLQQRNNQAGVNVDMGMKMDMDMDMDMELDWAAMDTMDIE